MHEVFFIKFFFLATNSGLSAWVLRIEEFRYIVTEALVENFLHFISIQFHHENRKF